MKLFVLEKNRENTKCFTEEEDHMKINTKRQKSKPNLVQLNCRKINATKINNNKNNINQTKTALRKEEELHNIETMLFDNCDQKRGR